MFISYLGMVMSSTAFVSMTWSTILWFGYSFVSPTSVTIISVCILNIFNYGYYGYYGYYLISRQLVQRKSREQSLRGIISATKQQ